MPNIADKIIYTLAIMNMPWVIRVYIFLILVIVGILLVVFLQGNPNQFGEPLFALASDALKTVLGALIGALSMAGEKILRNP